LSTFVAKDEAEKNLFLFELFQRVGKGLSGFSISRR